MSMEIYEKLFDRLKMYQDIAISEEQIKNHQVLDAHEALSDMRSKYGL